MILLMRGSSGGEGTGVPDPVENHKAKGFLANTSSDALKNHKATKPAFSDGGPLLVVIGPPSATSTLKKKKKKKEPFQS